MRSNYRRNPEKPSRRLQGFNYATSGACFITINTKNRIHHFGEVREGEMLLGEIGLIAEEEWIKSAELRSEIELDVYQFMPDHFHAVVWIVGIWGKEIPYYRSLPQSSGYKSKMRDVSKNLSSLVRGFKGAVTRRAQENGFSDFAWQKSFHDSIIRNQKELTAIRKYIKNNPSQWRKR